MYYARIWRIKCPAIDLNPEGDTFIVRKIWCRLRAFFGMVVKEPVSSCGNSSSIPPPLKVIVYKLYIPHTFALWNRIIFRLNLPIFITCVISTCFRNASGTILTIWALTNAGTSTITDGFSILGRMLYVCERSWGERMLTALCPSKAPTT